MALKSISIIPLPVHTGGGDGDKYDKHGEGDDTGDTDGSSDSFDELWDCLKGDDKAACKAALDGYIDQRIADEERGESAKTEADEDEAAAER